LKNINVSKFIGERERELVVGGESIRKLKRGEEKC
jgi:hypothetical protein